MNTYHKFSLYVVSPLLCYLVLLITKDSPQPSIFKYPHPTFLPQCERLNFTPKQNNKQVYSSVGLDFIFWKKMMGNKISCSE